MDGPESWKIKCAIRRADEVAMTDGGTLILRRDSLPPVDVEDTVRMPSLAPFAIDVPDEEDRFPPARNSDALGLRSTRDVEIGRSVTRSSFLAGLSAGLTAISLACALAFVSFTSDAFSSRAMPRRARTVAHGNASLIVIAPELATIKAAPKKRVKKVRAVESPESPETETADAEDDEPEVLPEGLKKSAQDAAGAERPVDDP
ncbi:MAG: hypothetical protein KIT84_29860 [Labilithrix sp.]|nr:hypothetical protein [Labilithrix sp.]MCW5815270.1 hypothetical protein [Labilithrix sp.]